MQRSGAPRRRRIWPLVSSIAVLVLTVLSAMPGLQSRPLVAILVLLIISPILDLAVRRRRRRPGETATPIDLEEPAHDLRR